MKTLRKKVFWSLYASTSAVIFIAVLLYNISNYLNTKDMLHDAARSIFVDPRYTNFIIQGFLNNLTTSLILLIVVLIVVYFIVKKISDWIVRPAEDAFEKQKDFIADASHELKTPLSVIVASSEALEKTKKNEKHINNIQEECSRMGVLISKLLDLVSTEKAEKEFFVEGDFSKTIELSALTFEGRALASNNRLNISIEKEIIFKYIENDIKQLVEILLDNAIKHADDGSTINLDLHKDGKQIVLEIVNVGEAIPDGEEEKIFERFYRVDKARNSKDNSYGLGLAIAKNIVQNHGGNISAKSFNKKTVFKANF